jgi:hypothetical protein
MNRKTPCLSEMASGHLLVVLQCNVNYHNFERIAETWAKRLSLEVLTRIENPFERIWDCRRKALKFWLSWDDNAPEIHLVPQDEAAAAETECIVKSLETK